MGEAFEAAQCLGIAKFRLEHNGRAEFGDEVALARNAGLAWEKAAHARDDLEFHECAQTSV